MATWKLKRTAQCDKCPWRTEVDPRDIPGGYCETKHRNLAETIAKPEDLSTLGQPVRVMACHETADAHCVGWVHNQIGEGNNIPLRLQMMSCENLDKLRLRGEQHPNFEATLPKALPSTVKSRAESARDALVLDYLDAFRQANPISKAPSITYENGWFIFDGNRREKRRMAKLMAMRDVLHARVAPKNTQKGEQE